MPIVKNKAFDANKKKPKKPVDQASITAGTAPLDYIGAREKEASRVAEAAGLDAPTKRMRQEAAQIAAGQINQRDLLSKGQKNVQEFNIKKAQDIQDRAAILKSVSPDEKPFVPDKTLVEKGTQAILTPVAAVANAIGTGQFGVPGIPGFKEQSASKIAETDFGKKLAGGIALSAGGAVLAQSVAGTAIASFGSAGRVLKLAFGSGIVATGLGLNFKRELSENDRILSDSETQMKDIIDRVGLPEELGGISEADAISYFVTAQESFFEAERTIKNINNDSIKNTLAGGTDSAKKAAYMRTQLASYRNLLATAIQTKRQLPVQ